MDSGQGRDHQPKSAARPPRTVHAPMPSTAGLGDALHLSHKPWPWRKAVGAPIATALAMGIGLALGHFDWGTWAFMGAFTSMYVIPLPYRQRAGRLAMVGLGLAAAMAIASLAAVTWWTMAIGLAVVASGSTYLAGAFDVPLPSGFMFVLIACITAALPVDPSLTPIRVGFALLGAGLAWLVGMAGWGWHPRGPERLAMVEAYQAIGRYAERADRAGGYSAWGEASQAVRTAEVRSEPLAQARHRSPEEMRLLLLIRHARRILDAMVVDPASLTPAMRRRVVRVAAAAVHPDQQLLTDEKTRPGRSRLARILFKTERVLTFHGAWPSLATSPAPAPGIGRRLAMAAARTSLVRVDALRMGIAIVVGTVLAALLGEPHPYWVPLTIAAVLQGQSTLSMANRGIQRAVGTTIGLALAGLLLLWHPTPIGTALVMLVLQFLLLALIVTNYALSVVFITALALVIIVTEVHAPLVPLLLARFADTLGGVAVAMAALLVLWPRDASQRIPAAIGEVLGHAGTAWDWSARAGRREPADDRHAVLEELDVSLLNLRSLTTDAAGEWWRSSVLTRWWPAIVSTERLGSMVRGTAVVSAAYHDRTASAQWGKVLRRLGEAALARRPPGTLTDLPAVGYPKALADSAEAVRLGLASALEQECP